MKHRRAGNSGPMSHRAEPARSVQEEDVPLIKGMLKRGDIQSDIASFFGTNGGRVCEINTGQKHPDAPTAPPERLPPPGPYMAARSAIKAKETLRAVHELIGETLREIDLWEVRRDVVEPEDPA